MKKDSLTYLISDCWYLIETACYQVDMCWADFEDYCERTEIPDDHPDVRDPSFPLYEFQEILKKFVAGEAEYQETLAIAVKFAGRARRDFYRKPQNNARETTQSTPKLHLVL